MSRRHGRHAVRFFAGRAPRAAAIADFAADALSAGEACVVVASAQVAADVRALLAARGLDASAADLRFVDAEQTAEEVLAHPEGAAGVFHATLAPLVREAIAASRARRGRVYGEAVDYIRRAGRRDQALVLEKLWTAFAEEARLEALCGYSDAAIDDDDAPWDYVERHNVVLPEASPTPRDRARAKGIERALRERMWMLRAVVAGEPKLALLPFGTAAMLWLKRAMPRAAAEAADAAR